IDGKWYTADKFKDPATLRSFGFNEKEIAFLAQHPLFELNAFYVKKYTEKFTDPWLPFGVGYDEFDKIPIADLYKKEGASAAALRFMGGRNTNALYYLWRLSLMYSRGIPINEGENFQLTQ